MKLSKVIFAIALLMAGCSKPQKKEEPAVAAVLPSAPSEGCWQPQMKADAKEAIEKTISYVFSHNVRENDPFSEIFTAPRKIEVDDFGFTSLDRDANHLVCNAWIIVTLNSKKYGVIVVPKAQVTYDITRTERGPEVSMRGTGIMGFLQSLNDAVAKYGLHSEYVVE